MAVTSNAERLGVWGASGSGKSTFVKREILQRKRVVIFDPLDEYGKGAGRNSKRFRVDTIEEVKNLIVKNWDAFQIAYVPSVGFEAESLSALSRMLMAAQGSFKKGVRGAKMVTIVAEELNEGFPLRGPPRGYTGFSEICSRGRHYGIEIIGVSQRLAEVATKFRGNCDRTVILRQQGPRDVDAAIAITGSSKTEISQMKNLEYIDCKNGDRKKGILTFK